MILKEGDILAFRFDCKFEDMVYKSIKPTKLNSNGTEIYTLMPRPKSNLPITAKFVGKTFTAGTYVRIVHIEEVCCQHYTNLKNKKEMAIMEHLKDPNNYPFRISIDVNGWPSRPRCWHTKSKSKQFIFRKVTNPEELKKAISILTAEALV